MQDDISAGPDSDPANVTKPRAKARAASAVARAEAAPEGAAAKKGARPKARATGAVEASAASSGKITANASAEAVKAALLAGDVGQAKPRESERARGGAAVEPMSDAQMFESARPQRQQAAENSIEAGPGSDTRLLTSILHHMQRNMTAPHGDVTREDAGIAVDEDMAALRAINDQNLRSQAVLAIDGSAYAQAQYSTALKQRAPDVAAEASAVRKSGRDAEVQRGVNDHARTAQAGPVAIGKPTPASFVARDPTRPVPGAPVTDGTKAVPAADDRAPASSRAAEKGAPATLSDAPQATFAMPAGLIGKLGRHGKAPYLHDVENEPSYFVSIEGARGEKTVWGVDLERAIKQSGARLGEIISLESKPVDGSKRKAWMVGSLDQARAFVQDEREQVILAHPDLIGAYTTLAAASAFAKQHFPGHEERFVAVGRQIIAANIAAGKETPAVQIRVLEPARQEDKERA